MTSTAGHTKTVLVADDTAFVRDRFRIALEQAGHHVVLVATADELRACIEDDPDGIDLLLLDLRLSDSTGTTLVSDIRRLEDRRLPILVFSGTVRGADDVRALARLGVSGYINEYSTAQHIVPAVSPHLSPDNFNRRSGPRVTVGIPVQYRFGNTVAAAVTLNLSHGGIAIRTTSPLDAGTRVRVRFKLPGTDTDANGRVVWSLRRLGMGIQFESVDLQQQAQIDSYVDAHVATGRKG